MKMKRFWFCFGTSEWLDFYVCILVPLKLTPLLPAIGARTETEAHHTLNASVRSML